jgi:hypothetical protein
VKKTAMREWDHSLGHRTALLVESHVLHELKQGKSVSDIGGADFAGMRALTLAA